MIIGAKKQRWRPVVAQNEKRRARQGRIGKPSKQGDKHEMCVDRSCGVNQLFNTICNLEGVLPDSLFIQLETQNLPEVLGKGNVLESDGPDEQPCHLPHAVAGIAATHAGDQETLVGAQGSILDEALYRLVK